MTHSQKQGRRSRRNVRGRSEVSTGGRNTVGLPFCSEHGRVALQISFGLCYPDQKPNRRFRSLANKKRIAARGAGREAMLQPEHRADWQTLER